MNKSDIVREVLAITWRLLEKMGIKPLTIVVETADEVFAMIKDEAHAR